MRATRDHANGGYERRIRFITIAPIYIYMLPLVNTELDWD